jgi:PadR family transcriptional regulator, regulatory protein PadR
MVSTPSISRVEAEILRLLIANGELYGMELVAASKMIKRGTIYVTLGRMADKGLVTSRAVKLEHERGMPRRLFAPTGLGQRVFAASQAAEAMLREAWA